MKYYMTTHHHGLGWLPDLPDQRDYTFTPAKAVEPTNLPKTIDLRADFPAIYDQGTIGSCTANALAAAFDFDRQKQGKAFISPSRLFIYWNERDLEGTTGSDSGATIRDGVKVLNKIGTPRETLWPYAIDELTVKPSQPAYDDALKNLALTYQRILRPAGNETGDMLQCLNEGYPFVTGFTVYESFESDAVRTTGNVPMPAPTERVLGGHAVVVVGYDLSTQRFTCRNSWGKDWGDSGYFSMPFAYLENSGLSSDQWVIRTVEINEAPSQNPFLLHNAPDSPLR